MAASDAEFREALLARKAELDAQDARSVGERAPVTLDQDSVGRLSRMDAMQVQAMALAQERRRKAERVSIDAALARIDAGDFGYCAICADAIAPARLANNPTVVKCLACASGR